MIFLQKKLEIKIEIALLNRIWPKLYAENMIKMIIILQNTLNQRRTA